MTETARRYAGLSAEERDARRRERLRAACRKLIGSEGYSATTIERICSTAGVSTRNFYEHYDSKEAAFIDLYESITTASYAAAAQSLADTAGQDFKDRVPQAFLAYIRPMVQDVQSARIAFVEIMGVSPRLEERRLGFRESLVQLCEAEGTAAVQRGEIDDRDFRFAAVALAGAASSIVYDWTLREDRSSVAELEASLTKFAVNLLAGPQV